MEQPARDVLGGLARGGGQHHAQGLHQVGSGQGQRDGHDHRGHQSGEQGPSPIDAAGRRGCVGHENTLSLKPIGNLIRGDGCQGAGEGELSTPLNPVAEHEGVRVVRRAEPRNPSTSPRHSSCLPPRETLPLSVVSVKTERGCQRLWKSGLDLAPLVVHRHKDHLPGRRRAFLLRRTQAQMVKEAPDGQLVGDVGGRRSQAFELSRRSPSSAARPAESM